MSQLERLAVTNHFPESSLFFQHVRAHFSRCCFFHPFSIAALSIFLSWYIVCRNFFLAKKSSDPENFLFFCFFDFFVIFLALILYFVFLLISNIQTFLCIVL
eukprot:Pompholyxophrys_punicea_v1_NODE_41_length_4663_cov_8.672092.p4 type:complete len:102 gc:universal NODE_41_length_4663_cov_8.672092:4102-4407(+)